MEVAGNVFDLPQSRPGSAAADEDHGLMDDVTDASGSASKKYVDSGSSVAHRPRNADNQQ